MSDDPADRGDNTPTTTSFEEWLDQHAASQGISREELFERLVSSYWTLNEMMQLLDDSGQSSPSVGQPSDGADDTTLGSAPTTRDSRSESPRDAPRETTPRARNPPGTDSPRRDSGSRTDRSPRPDDSSPDSPPEDDVEEQLTKLRERVDSLQADLEQEAERGKSLDELAEAVATRLTQVEGRLDELESASEATESLSQEFDELSERVDTLEAELRDEQESLAEQQDSMAAAQDSLATTQEELSAGQQELRSWLDSEFDSLQTILEYLVSRADELESRHSSAEDRYEAELSRLRAERQALQSIKQEAAAQDAHVGMCDSCEGEIDLDLLARPYCPNCDARLHGIDVRKKWLLFSDVVVTTDESTDGSPADRPTAGSQTSQRRGETSARSASTPTERERSIDQSPSADGHQTPASDSSFGADSTGASDVDSTSVSETGSTGTSETGSTGTSETESSFQFTGVEDGSETEASAQSKSADDAGFSPSDIDSGDDGGHDASPSERTAPDTKFQIGSADEAATSSDTETPFGDLEDLEREEQGGSD